MFRSGRSESPLPARVPDAPFGGMVRKVRTPAIGLICSNGCYLPFGRMGSEVYAGVPAKICSTRSCALFRSTTPPPGVSVCFDGEQTGLNSGEIRFRQGTGLFRHFESVPIQGKGG